MFRLSWCGRVSARCSCVISLYNLESHYEFNECKMQHLLFIAINRVQLSRLFVSAYVVSHCVDCDFFFLNSLLEIITTKIRANQLEYNSNYATEEKEK